MVDGRVFVRSWGLEPGGWYRTLRDDPAGAIELDGREVKIRAVQVRSERLRGAIERAYADKYTTSGARQFVRGFRTKRRREATLELVRR